MSKTILPAGEDVVITLTGDAAAAYKAAKRDREAFYKERLGNDYVPVEDDADFISRLIQDADTLMMELD